MEIQGSRALVTGGAVRLGRAISLALASAGADVVVHYHSSSAEADRLVGEIEELGQRAVAIRADLASLPAVRSLADEAESAFGGINILVNNASTFPAEPFGEVSESTWESAMSVNLRAPFFLSQILGGAMKARGKGVIINLADLAGLQAWRGYAAHAISKAGLVHLTRVAARALAPEVRVVGIAPGTVLPPEDLPDGVVSDLANRAPLKKIGSPEDVTRTLLYLLASDFITGQVIPVDGGRLII